jgi:hypothetical protein
MVFLVLAASLRSTSVLNSEREEKGERRRARGERWPDLALQAQREGLRPNLACLLQWWGGAERGRKEIFAGAVRKLLERRFLRGAKVVGSTVLSPLFGDAVGCSPETG